MMIIGNSMPMTKIAAFFEEFPWLSQYSMPKHTTQIYVRRVDKDMLGRPPKVIRLIPCLDAEGHNGKDVVESEVRILDSKGRELIRVGHILVPTEKLPWYISWMLPTQAEFQVRQIDETVYDALLRLGSSEKKRDGFFILQIIRSETYGDQTYGTHVTIYKSAKNTDLVTWLEQEMDKSRTEVKSEVEAS